MTFDEVWEKLKSKDKTGAYERAEQMEDDLLEDILYAYAQGHKRGYDIGYAQGNERPKGKWLIEGGTTLHFCCSECGCAGDNWDKFCKHCGAQMEAMKE